MKDNSMPPWDDDMLKLLQAEQEIPNDSNGLREQVASRLAMSVEALGWNEGMSEPSAPQLPVDSGDASSWVSSAWVKVALTTALVFPAGFYAGRESVQPLPVAADVPAKVVAEERAEEPPPLLIAPTSAPMVTVKPKGYTSRAIDGTLAEERALLELARTAIMSNRLDEASKALQRHEASFKSGRLKEERESLKIQLLLVSGKNDQAHKALERFEKQFPDSMLLPALHEAIR